MISVIHARKDGKKCRVAAQYVSDDSTAMPYVFETARCVMTPHDFVARLAVGDGRSGYPRAPGGAGV